MRIIFDSEQYTSFSDYKEYCKLNDIILKEDKQSYEDYVKDMRILNEDDFIFDMIRKKYWDKPCYYLGYMQEDGKVFPIIPAYIESFKKAYQLIHPPFPYKVKNEGSEFHFEYEENDVQYTIILCIQYQKQ